MSDYSVYRELEKFANDHTLATNIKVEISPHHKRFTPRKRKSARYEDVILLHNIIMGAESYLFWKTRNRKKDLKRASKIKVELFKNKRNKWMWRLKARNGKILAVSEDYSSREKAFNTVDLLVGYLNPDMAIEIIDK